MDSLAPSAPLASRPDTPDAFDDEALTKVDPAYKTALRISVALACAPIIIGAAVLETALVEGADGRWPVPSPMRRPSARLMSGALSESRLSRRICPPRSGISLDRRAGSCATASPTKYLGANGFPSL